MFQTSGDDHDSEYLVPGGVVTRIVIVIVMVMIMI